MQAEISKGLNLLQINQIGKMDRNGYSSQRKPKEREGRKKIEGERASTSSKRQMFLL